MAVPFAFDAASGRLSVPALKVDVTPGMQIADYDPDHLKNKPPDVNHWQRYFLREVRDDSVVGVGLYFWGGKLKHVDLGYGTAAESGWANWSEARERAKVESYERDLTAALGEKREFAWGETHASYDEKAGGASIWINYR